MPDVTFEQLAVAMDRAARELTTGMVRTVRDLTNETLRTVRRNASGRPGPNRITGRYLASMTASVTVSGDTVEGTVGTNEARARRLENGFYGTDSLGRHYSQPPYPHWRPAAEAMEPKVRKALERAVGDAIG